MDSAWRGSGVKTIAVERLDDPALDGLLEPYRNQRDAWLRARRSGGTGLADGLFMAEGELVVRALVESREHRTVSVLCTPTRLEAMSGVLSGLPEGTPVLVAEREVLEGIVGFDLHRGVLALGARGVAPTMGSIVAGAGLVVVCEDLANHDNAGAIFRNVACLAGGTAGAGLPAAVLLSPGCCDPLYRKSLRVSMGHALRVPFTTIAPWPSALGVLVRAGFEVVALTPEGGAEDVREFRRAPNRRLALVVGAEGVGLTSGAFGGASRRVRIPMGSGADSLNVATALAVALSWLG